jgi:hypothetical protein
LDTTNAGKLGWTLVANPSLNAGPNQLIEEFRADIGDQQLITVRRTSEGDNRQFDLVLSIGTETILQGKAANFISPSTGNTLLAYGASAPLPAIPELIASGGPDLQRFNLYSDLFLAARSVATGEESPLAKFKSSLEKVGMS